MYGDPMELGRAFPVRKTKKQKQAFQEAVMEYARSLGYQCFLEQGSFGCRNVVMGDPERAEFLVTAHYDTCAGMLLPNLITPCSLPLFLGYQLFMVLWMLLVPAVPGLAVGYLSGSVMAGWFVWYGLFWVLLLMLLFGPANRHNANDNTSGVVTVLEIMKSLPKLHRDKVCFVLFDLEEVGLFGSSAYRKAHRKATDHQLVLNLDCVGDGEELMMFPTRKLKKDPRRMEWLRGISGDFGEKSLTLRETGFSVYPSDQKSFPLGVGICALRRGRLGLYLGRIHTWRDTLLDQTNVNILRAALTTLVTRNERRTP